MVSVSKEHEHKGFKVSAKLCLNFCSFRWLKSTLNLLRRYCSLSFDVFVLVFQLVLVLLPVISGMLDILFLISSGGLMQTLFSWFVLSWVSFTFFSQLSRSLDDFYSSGFSSSVILRALFNSHCWSTGSLIGLGEISKVINKLFCLISSLKSMFHVLGYLCVTSLKIIEYGLVMFLYLREFDGYFFRYFLP